MKKQASKYVDIKKYNENTFSNRWIGTGKNK
jgi:hypothetical protein